MRKIVDVILVVIVVALAVYAYWFQEDLGKSLRNLVLGEPCEKPILYSLGELDPRFDLDVNEARVIVEESAERWDRAYGKNLFEYSEESPKVIVNFVYDRRQEVTETLSLIDKRLDFQNTELMTLKGRYDSLKQDYETRRSNYESLKVSTQELEKIYITEVSRWNKKGGLPKNVQEDLVRMRQELSDAYAKLSTNATLLNNKVKELNEIAATLNKSVANYNETARNYNNTAGSLEPEFEEGEYIVDEYGERINIYQYSDEIVLKRVLMHEFGHALGLDHIENEDSIMHYINSKRNLSPTEYDLNALSILCQSN